MNKKWKVKTVSTPEQIFDKIREEMAQPVGVVLFGADCEFKSKTVGGVAKGLVNSALFRLGGDDLPSRYSKMRIPQRCTHPYFFVLYSSASSSHDVRHEWFQAIRSMGAKTVVGIYVKAKKKSIPFGKAIITVVRNMRFNRQIDAIEQSNPTAGGLVDCFVEIDEEEG